MREAVRTTRDPRQADEWGLVLTARGIAFELEPTEDGEIRLWTRPEDAERAAAELRAFDEENRPPPPAPAVPRWGFSAVGLVVAWLLLAGFAVLSSESLFSRGSARAERVLGGEPWRAVTALTLHADLPHVLGNAAMAAVMLSAAAWRIGPGVALAASLAAGIAGNVLTAWLYVARHDAVGASTATFGMLGVVTANALHDAYRYRVRPRAPWVLLGGSLALLGFLGSNEGSDVLAHASGWACGVAFGLAAIAARPRPLGAGGQWALVAVCVGVIAGAWLLAVGG